MTFSQKIRRIKRSNIGILSIIAVTAFIAGAFTASPELRAYAANTVGSVDIINNSIQSIDIKNGEVKTIDIGANAVTTAKIAGGGVQNTDIAANAVDSAKINDGSIIGNDVSASFIKHVVLHDDAAGNAAGWQSGIDSSQPVISDIDVHGTDSIVVINVVNYNGSGIGCFVKALNEGSFTVECNIDVYPGSVLNYLVINPA